MAFFNRLRPSRWNHALVALCAASLWEVTLPVVTGPVVAAEPSLASQAQPSANPMRLLYTSTNADAGEPARYGLFFPVGSQSLQRGGHTWTLLFDAELDVQAYRRRLQFCYRTDRAGRLPRHSQCLESIPAQIDVSVGPGQDRVTIATQESIDPDRQLGLWLDLINPIQPGLFPIQLLSQSSLSNGETVQPIGVWTIRIEQADFDSPGSAE